MQMYWCINVYVNYVYVLHIMHVTYTNMTTCKYIHTG